MLRENLVEVPRTAEGRIFLFMFYWILLRGCEIFIIEFDTEQRKSSNCFNKHQIMGRGSLLSWYKQGSQLNATKKKKKNISCIKFSNVFFIFTCLSSFFSSKLLIWISKNFLSSFCLNVIAFTFYLINYSFIFALLLYSSWRLKWVHANNQRREKLWRFVRWFCHPMGQILISKNNSKKTKSWKM